MARGVDAKKGDSFLAPLPTLTDNRRDDASLDREVMKCSQRQNRAMETFFAGRPSIEVEILSARDYAQNKTTGRND